LQCANILPGLNSVGVASVIRIRLDYVALSPQEGELNNEETTRDLKKKTRGDLFNPFVLNAE
jgi:hypothetical protein